jgi:hypothetical protein
VSLLSQDGKPLTSKPPRPSQPLPLSGKAEKRNKSYGQISVENSVIWLFYIIPVTKRHRAKNIRAMTYPSIFNRLPKNINS